MFEFFLNPWLLGGLAFATAPVIIHLLNRRRYEVHDWAAMEFLLQAQVMNRRRLKLEDLILLLLRILLILLLVFSVARPVIEGLASWREDERVIIVDDSGSMGATGGTGFSFGAARDAAKSQIQDALGSSIPVSFWFGSRPDDGATRVIGRIEGGVIDAESENKDELSAAQAGSELLSTVGTSEPSGGNLELGRVLDRIMHEAADDKEPTLRSVVILSDQREQDWLTGPAADQFDYVLDELNRRELADRFRLEFHNLGFADVENVGISDFRAETQHALAGVLITFIVDVTNYGTEARSSIEGQIEVGRAGVKRFEPAHRIPLPRIDRLAAGETRQIEVRHVFDDAGEYPLRAEIDGDRLPGDDESFLVMPVRKGLRVVLSDGLAASNSVRRRDSDFIVRALAPLGDEPTGVDPVVHDGPIDGAVLKEADVVLLLNRSGLAADERDVLTRFIEDGGGVGYFLGERVEPETYRQLSAADGDKPGIFPANLGKLVDRRGKRRVRVTIEDDEHPLFNAFRGQQAVSLARVLFDRYRDIELGDSTTVLARFNDADKTPAVFERAIGEGKLLVFNTTADRDWTDWPTDVSFPIVSQELIRHLAKSRVSARLVSASSPIIWEGEPGYRYSVIDTHGTEHAIEASSSERLSSFARTQDSGFYQVVATPTAGSVADAEKREWYASRWLTQESELKPAERKRIESLVEGSGVQVNFEGDNEVDSFKDRQDGEIWRWLAAFAGIVLLLELLAAWWFGRK